MAFFTFNRIKCHFCGARSPHAKGCGIPEYQCASCEALNFLDPKGNIIDTPYTSGTVAPLDRPIKLFESFTRDPASDPAKTHQTQQVFCNTCLHNQQVYNEALANYLPDDDHPQYVEYERSLPQWKADLEKRYPQICVACAPKAQLKINRADYYSVTNNLNKTHMRQTRRRGASPVPAIEPRDDWHKAGMRMFLGLLGLIMWAGMVAQVCWHAYGIWDTFFGREMVAVREEDLGLDNYEFDATVGTCVAAATRFHSEKACHQLFGSFMPRVLLANLCLIWYNHGLRAYYDPMIRYDHITGQIKHFWVQLIVMAIRTASYVGLSDESRLSEMKWSQIVAVHVLTVAIILGGRALSRGSIQIHRWRLTNKMMPKPEDEDVLGKFAGPATVKHVPEAASRLPFDIFAKKHKEPFPIHALAPSRSTYGTNVWNRASGGPPPSPQGSDSTIEDPMDLDSPTETRMNFPGLPDNRKYNPYAATTTGRHARQSTVSQRFGQPSPKGWEDMRSNLFSIEDDLRNQTERQKFEAAQNAAKLRYNPPVEQSPFRGRLPQAPMSMERRIRNPITQVPQFKEPPVTQQKNFLDQMREGIDKGKPFGRSNRKYERQTRSRRSADDVSDYAETTENEFSPAATRTRGNLDLRPSDWHLPTDTATQATGLEDLFAGSSFRISESPPAREQVREPRSLPAGLRWTIIATGALVALGLFAYNVNAIRRLVFLGLYDILVGMGL